MSGGPRGTSPPLDLRAVGIEADVTRMMPPDVQYGGPWQDAALRHAETIDRLLAHARALRAALEQTLGTHHDTDMDGTHRGDYDPNAPPCARCLAEERAIAVLAAAQDGPA